MAQSGNNDAALISTQPVVVRDLAPRFVSVFQFPLDLVLICGLLARVQEDVTGERAPEEEEGRLRDLEIV